MKFKNIGIVSLLIIIFTSKVIVAKSFNIIEDRLMSIGVEKEYRENIITYIEALDLSNEDVSNIVTEIEDLKTNLIGKSTIRDFKFSELFSMYNRVKNIALDMGLVVDVVFSDKELILKDRKRKNVLFKGDIDRLYELYSNYNAKGYDKNEDLMLVYEEIKNTDIIKQVERIYDNEISNEYIVDNKQDTVDLKSEENEVNTKINEEDELSSLFKEVGSINSYDHLTIVLFGCLCGVLVILTLLILRRSKL